MRENTKLFYLEDFDLFACDARVVDILEENGRSIILLDQTIFYPQGGGQPYDKGIIERPSAKFLVEEVRFVDGVVKHIGKFESGAFNVGDEVKCSVDSARRALHSRIHSAGHVVDMAVTALNLNWVPGKGYHFPEGPYVEYVGSLGEMDKEKMKEVFHFVPDYIPEGKPARVVMYGDFGVPCGGTHVGNLGDIRHTIIRKIKAEGAHIRVAYDIER